MIEHGFAKRGINLTTVPARLLYRSAYVVLISSVACTIPFFGVRAAAWILWSVWSCALPVWTEEKLISYSRSNARL